MIVILFRQGSRQTEVCDLHDVILHYENIPRCEISVNDLQVGHWWFNMSGNQVFYACLIKMFLIRLIHSLNLSLFMNTLPISFSYSFIRTSDSLAASCGQLLQQHNNHSLITVFTHVHCSVKVLFYFDLFLRRKLTFFDAR